MNNQLKDIFFQLLRIGLWGEGKLTLISPITLEDWNTIRKYAANHTVEGIIYDSFTFLEEHQLPPQSLRLKWAVRMDQIERHNDKMNQVIAEQFSLFNDQGIRPILQKGQGVASYYRNPSHRISGDIDWCFEADGYEMAIKYLKDSQINFQDSAGLNLDYNWKGIHIEHHKKTFDFRNPLRRNYLNKLLLEYKDRQKVVTINAVPVQLLAPELQLLQVNVHILKHLITYGIGLRQFCDSARLYHCTASQIDPVALEKIYRKTGILKWIHLLHRILVEQIGLPNTSLPFAYPENINADWMLDEVWYSGNFGLNDERYKDGKDLKLFTMPDSPKRLWQNFRRYIKYAPQETIAFPLLHAYAKLVGKHRE
jgi:hypothetical protein